MFSASREHKGSHDRLNGDVRLVYYVTLLTTSVMTAVVCVFRVVCRHDEQETATHGTLHTKSRSPYRSMYFFTSCMKRKMSPHVNFSNFVFNDINNL